MAITGFEVLPEKNNDMFEVRTPNGSTVLVNSENAENALASAQAHVNKSIQNNTKDRNTAIEMLGSNDLWLSNARSFYKNKDPANVQKDWYNDDDLLTQHFASDMRWRDVNTLSAAKRLGYTYSGISDEQKKLTAYMYNSWDSIPKLFDTGGAGFSGLFSNIARGLVDPINALFLIPGIGWGAGAGIKGAALTGGTAARAGVKAGVNAVGTRPLQTQANRQVMESVLQGAVKTGVKGGALDGTLSGAFTLADQAERVKIDMQSKIDYSKVFESAALGAVAGFGFTSLITGVTRSLPLKSSTESNALRKGINKVLSGISSAGILGKYGKSFVEAGQTLTAKKNAANLEIESAALNFEDELIKFFKAEKDVSITSKDVRGAYQEIMRDANHRTTVNDIVSAAKNEVIESKMFNDINTPLAAPHKKPEITSNVGQLILNANPKLKQTLMKLVSINPRLRRDIINGKMLDEDATNAFLRAGDRHETRVYKAFTDPFGNLDRIRSLKEDGHEQYKVASEWVARQINKNGKDGSTVVHADSPEVDSIIEQIALGRLKEAKIRAQEIANTDPTLRDVDLLGELNEFINVDKSRDSHVDVLVDTLADDVNKITGKKITGKKEAVGMKKRKELSEGLKNILQISNDPVERILATNQNLAAIKYMSDFSNEVSFFLMQTGQLDRALATGSHALKTKTVGEISDLSTYEKIKAQERGLDSTAFSKAELEQIAKEYNTVKNKTIADSVKDGDIQNSTGLEIMLKANDDARELAYQSVSRDSTGKVYNPLATMLLSKEYKDALEQTIHGARFNVDGALLTMGTAINKVNVFAQLMKTVYSPVTISRNFVGGFIQYNVVSGGIIPSPSQLSYLKDVYFPLWREITDSLRKGQSASEVALRLKNKGKTPEQIDDIMEDVLEMYGTGILDVDLAAENSRMFKRQVKDIKGTTGKIAETLDNFIYNKNGMNVRSIDQLMRRNYATGDEIFKALYFNQRKRFYLDAGFEKTFAIKRSAQDVRRRLPNYRLQGTFLKGTRAAGLGTFTSFTTEITRNTKNIIVDAMTDFKFANKLIAEGRRLNNPLKIRQGTALRTDASKRLGKFMGAAALGAGGAEAMWNNTEDESVLEALRDTMQLWDRNGQHLILTKDKDNANVQFLDLSYMNPFAPLMRFIPSIMREADRSIRRGEDFDEAYTKGFAKALAAYLSPYLNPGLGISPLANITLGLFNEDERQFNKAYRELVKNITPGAFNEISKYYDVVTGAHSKPFNQGVGKNIERNKYSKMLEDYKIPVIGSLDPSTKTEVGRLLTNLFGVTVKNHNFEKAKVNQYRQIKTTMIAGQKNFKSSLARGTSYDEDLFNKEDLDAALAKIQGIDPSKVRNLKDAEDFIETFAEANASKFEGQRELYAAMLSHKTVLQTLTGYEGDSDEVSSKIFKKLVEDARLAGVSKTDASRLASSVAYNLAPPVYVPFKITRGNIEKLNDRLLVSKVSDENRRAMIEYLINGTEKVSKQLKGISLAINIQS